VIVNLLFVIDTHGYVPGEGPQQLESGGIEILPLVYKRKVKHGSVPQRPKISKDLLADQSEIRPVFGRVPGQSPADLLLVVVDNPEIESRNTGLRQVQQIQSRANVVFQHIRERKYAQPVRAYLVLVGQITRSMQQYLRLARTGGAEHNSMLAGIKFNRPKLLGSQLGPRY
jgi:hypothetical protein